jgi:hypothetical protein
MSDDILDEGLTRDKFIEQLFNYVNDMLMQQGVDNGLSNIQVAGVLKVLGNCIYDVIEVIGVEEFEEDDVEGVDGNEDEEVH